jgi:hypothetical protein
VNGKRLFFRPNLLNSISSISKPTEKRIYPLVIHNAYTDIDTAKFELPEGFRPEFMPDAVRLKSKFGEYEVSFGIEDQQITYSRKLIMYKGQFDPGDYVDYVEFVNAMAKTDRIKLVLVKKT